MDHETKNVLHGHSEPDAWAASSLPTDLLLEIFLRLEPAAAICCAAVCKPWRRTIVGNASILGAHLDRFFGPSLLLGMFHYYTTAACLLRTPGPFQSALPSNCGGGGGDVTLANKLTPAAASAAVPSLLWCKDGFILLRARSVNSLCLCNPITGYCRVLPAAAAPAAKQSSYVLLTGASSDDDDNPAVRILAVHSRRDEDDSSSGAFDFYETDEETLAYQLFSTTSGKGAGVWGPLVQCSGDEITEEGRRRRLCVWMDRRSTAVGQDCVHWLAGTTREVTCVFALDVRTGLTWTTDLPEECRRLPAKEPTTCILSMSGDGGRLSLMQLLRGPVIQVWVLSDDDDDDDDDSSCGGGGSRWSRQRTIQLNVKDLASHCPAWGHCHPILKVPWTFDLSAFYPRSRCVVVSWSGREFLVDIGSSGSHPRVVRLMPYQRGPYSWPYEMESSSIYISKMKKF